MKNLVKLATAFALFVGSFAFGQTQKATSSGTSTTAIDDDTRLKLATMMATFTDNVSVVYNTGMTYVAFRGSVLGRTGAAVTTEGEVVLNKAYNYLVSGTSGDQIINTDSGIEMGQAYAKLDQLGISNEYALFSTPSDAPKLDTNINPRQHEAKGSGDGTCKWYQIGCWIDQIFGAGTASGIMGVIIAWLKVRLAT
ncbi:MAG: hypothetical protein QM564_10865 [Bergeyella sp.]